MQFACKGTNNFALLYTLRQVFIIKKVKTPGRHQERPFSSYIIMYPYLIIYNQSLLFSWNGCSPDVTLAVSSDFMLRKLFSQHMGFRKWTKRRKCLPKKIFVNFDFFGWFRDIDRFRNICYFILHCMIHLQKEIRKGKFTNIPT